MYKSIVFDLGGVMVDFAPRAYLVDRICNEEIEEQVYDLTFGSEEWKQLDAGLVSRFDGNQAMLRNAKAAGREFEVQGVLDDWLHILRPRRRMQELVRRLNRGKDFPHEIGLFLGYPAEDVSGFIRHGARCAKCVGTWKVYGDEESARKKFALYQKCTRLYCEAYRKHNNLDRLLVRTHGN